MDTAPASAATEPAVARFGIDLNTASVEELNALGAGMIGRRIVAYRPGTVNFSSGVVTPSSSSAAKVSALIVEPGS